MESGGHRGLAGTVIPGRGLGAVRMARSDTLVRLQELVGFPVVPGTLNVRLAEPFEQSLRSSYVAASEIGPGWETETGQAGYLFAPVLIAGRYRGVVFQADEPGYPPGQVEMLCEVTFGPPSV